MKKIAVLVALIIVLTVAACSTENKSTPSEPSLVQDSAPQQPTTTSPSSPTGSGQSVDMGLGTGAAGEKSDETPEFPNCNADGTINLDRIAHYDINYDYTQNDRIKTAYLVQQNSPLFQEAAVAYEHWASLYNMEWMGFISSNGDPDMFLTTLQALIDQGVRAFVLDPDTSIMPSVYGILTNNPEVAWMTHAAPPRDAISGDGIPIGGNLVHPSVGFNHYDAGYQVTKKLIEWKVDTFPEVAWKDVGMICMSYSTSPPLQERVIATQELWLEATGSLDNFFIADTAAFGLSFQGGIDAVSPVITTNTDYKYWLVNGLIDDLAQSAAAIIDQQGLTDNSCVITFGGTALQTQWDAGQYDSFRYALFTANNLYAEPVIGAVYAYLQGWATPDSIWPSWVKWDDHGAEGHTYSQLRLPLTWLEQDTYKHYLAWTDMYANSNMYDYSHSGVSLDDYSPFVNEIPADYSAP